MIDALKGGRLALLATFVLACSSSPEGSNRDKPAPQCGNGIVETGEQCDSPMGPPCALITGNPSSVGNTQCLACQINTQSCVPGQNPGTGGMSAGGSAGNGGGFPVSGGITGQGGIPMMSGTSSGGSAGAGGFVTTAGGAGAGGAGPGGNSSAGGASSGGPNVVIPGVECGGSDIKEVTTDIGGRKVYIDYPCGKPQGTPVTFVLQLHGTMDQESGRHYIRGYFPVYKYMDQYNFITATPTSVVSQWGNGDGGQDEPHLMAVIDWVYTNFSNFDIKQMWITGHSWGAMYARTFACKTEFTSKVHGVVLMSGGGTMPACADRLAALGTVGENDIVTGELAQGPTASAHGCSAQQTLSVGNNRVTAWPSCQPGWVHRDYFMLGKGHGFVPTDWPEEVMTHDMAESIASTR